MAKKRKNPLPASVPDDLPGTLDEAVAFLQRVSSAEVIAEVKNTPFDDLILLHRDIGMQVRNVLGLWGRNPTLLESLPVEKRWPDNAAIYIIEAWWRILHDD